MWLAFYTVTVAYLHDNKGFVHFSLAWSLSTLLIQFALKWPFSLIEVLGIERARPLHAFLLPIVCTYYAHSMYIPTNNIVSNNLNVLYIYYALCTLL